MTDWLRYPILTPDLMDRTVFVDREAPTPTPVCTLTPDEHGIGWYTEPNDMGTAVWMSDLMLKRLGYARVHPKWNSPSYWASLPEEDE